MAADLERSTRELQAERDKVAALLQAQRELTAGVSHELRTPIATVKGYLDSLLQHWEARPPETLPHDLQVMAHEAERLEKLVEDLLTLSRAEVNQLSLELCPVVVKEVAGRVVSSLAPLAWASGRVQVVCEVAEGLPPVLADAGRLEQALLNLLHNAVRHTPPGGIVAVAAESGGDHVRLDVIDTGEGIPPDDLPFIWQRFYRAGNLTPSGDNGVGLGLALVKELTEAMGGQVAVESTRGEGSRFSIYLLSS
jgi:signal transduction histidine kinase